MPSMNAVGICDFIPRFEKGGKFETISCSSIIGEGAPDDVGPPFVWNMPMPMPMPMDYGFVRD